MRRNLINRNSSIDLDAVLSVYSRFQNGEKEIQARVEELFLSLPNFSHPNSPVGAASEFRLLHLHGCPKSPAKSKNEVDLLSNEITSYHNGNRGRRGGLGVLRTAGGGLVRGCGPRSYVFYDDLAQLESALVELTLDRCRMAGFEFIVVPDILPASVIERCGFPTTGERNQVFKIDAERRGSPNTRNTYCLSGTGEMGLAGFCSDRVFGGSDVDAQFFCTVSRCFRHEVAPSESLLYRTHQFTKVEVFCVSRPSEEAGEVAFEKILHFQKCLYSDLELHFRVLEMPTSELGDPAYRKVDIEALMPGEGTYGEISSTSNCTDYQATRLNIRWKEDHLVQSHPFAYTLNGTGCAVTRVLKALVETHQNKDGSVDLPRALWPFLNGTRKLKAPQSPLVTS